MTRRGLAAIGAVAAVSVGAGALAQGTGTCTTVTPGIYVDLPPNDHQVYDHARDAVQAGAPRILHLDRDHADEHRAASLRGWPTRPGYDRDEYPPAASREGGAGADVRYIDPGENRSAGAIMRNQLAPYCDGQAFILEP